MLFGWLVSGIFLITLSVLRSATSTVDSASLVMYRRVPSGDAAAPWFTSISLISPTTLFVSGSISITLSPAALVWTILTVEACRTRVVKIASAKAIESLVFIATHFKLPGHVAHPLFHVDPADLVHPRLRVFQDQGPAAAARKAARTRPVLDLPRTKHRLPPGRAAQGAHRVHRGGNAEELRGGEPLRAARRAAQKPAADDAPGARGGRHRVPSRRQTLGVAERSGVEGPGRLGEERGDFGEDARRIV